MSRYILFTQDEHEKINLDFERETINRVVAMWHLGYTDKYICQELKISDVELGLIIIDLHYCDRLKRRKNGFLGSVGGDLVHEIPTASSNTARKIWTEQTEQELIDYFYEHGMITKEGYKFLAEKHEKTVQQIRSKISHLRKAGKLPKISA